MLYFVYTLVTLFSVYVGTWKIGCCGIFDACMAFDNGTLTDTMIIWTIVKFLILAPAVTAIVASTLLIIIEVIRNLKERL